MGIVYDLERWRTYEWESETRYYRAQIKQTLFGDWCVVCTWGGRNNRLGSGKTLYAASLDEAKEMVRAIAKRRQRRGYLPLPILGTSEIN